jgi:curved DNA-binding protein CbpA
MVNHYDILKVSPKASNAEIKSAYRKLARKVHPDKHNGAEEKSQEFARIAKAYQILGNPKSRAEYDKQTLQVQYSNSANGDSVFNSDNLHAKKWRQMAYEKRYNDIIDRMIADERRESIALQKTIFPIVALFASTLFAAIWRPEFFTKSAIIGKIIFMSLFVVSVIHLISRFRVGFEKYTYGYENLHDSILDGNEPETKPYSRFTAITFLVAGVLICLGIGILIGSYIEFSTVARLHSKFSISFNPEIIFYPPIVVLFVDMMHSVAARFE